MSPGTTSESTVPAGAASKPPRSWIRWTAVVLAAGGWWLSLDLVRLGFGQAASNPWLQAECGAAADTPETFDCQSVLNSQWASVPLSQQSGGPRLPVAVLGMGYFAFVGLWYLFVGPPTRRRWGWHLLIAAVVGCGLWQSLYMVYVMGSVLHRWCWGCVAAHAVNGGLALLTVIAFPWRRDRVGVAPHPSGRLALATLLAGTFLFLLHLTFMLVLLANNSARQVYQAHRRIVDDPEFICWQYERQPVQTIADADQPTSVGDADAPNTVVAFIDYQCSACQSACEVLSSIMREHPGLLRVDYRHFPLDRACNEYVPRSAHPAACRASMAVQAARRVGGAEGFRKMQELLHERQSQLETAAYAEWARELGLDVVAFSAAVRSQDVADRIESDIALGRQLGVETVPVLFLNGRKVEYWSKAATWEALLGLKTDAAPTTGPAAP
jgi:protein-disulfide isomerase/uncharacterized membrane protein